MADQFGTPIVLRVEGMMCQNSCAKTVQNAIIAVEGVKSADVSFPEKTAKVHKCSVMH